MKNASPGKSAFKKLLEKLSAPLNSRGVIFIAVIWVCALIMWFSLQISAQTRLEGEDQIHSIRKSQALHLAIGGCYEALARLGQPPPLLLNRGANLNWQPDGQPHIVEYETGVAIVIVESEGTKVNVNMAQEVQLRQVLQRAGADELSSEELADRIMDFIDADDIPRPHGMEKDGYIRLGLNYIPFDGPLTSLDQLLLIPGLSQQLFYGYDQGMGERMREFPEILKDIAIPGKNSLFSLLTIYGTNVNLPQDDEQQEAMLQAKTWVPGGIYRILSFGKTPNGPPSAGIWMIVRLAGDSASPYKILSRKTM
ncbi:MAG: general secretion pathway protein GspK [Syntrophobacteraceae bacterium]